MHWVLAEQPEAAQQGPPGLQLYSLSAEGGLLMWGPLQQPLADLFRSGQSGASGSAGSSWAQPGSTLAALLGSPLDVRALLAATAAAEGPPSEAATSWRAAEQPAVVAVALLQAGSPAAEAAGAGGHLLAVAARDGALAVLHATPATAVGGLTLRLLWATPGDGSVIR